MRRHPAHVSTAALLTAMVVMVCVAPARANQNAADTVNADRLWPGGGLGYNLTGAGVTVGLWEAIDGGDWEPMVGHEAFTWGQPPSQSRISFGEPGNGGTSDHATHVAGTIGGAHIPDKEIAWGMAPGVEILAYSSSSDNAELLEAPVDISNHSYGSQLGGWSTRSWDIPDGQGGTTTKNYATWFYLTGVYFRDHYDEDPRFGQYNFFSMDLDQTLEQRPHLLSIWSAGNDRASGYSDVQNDRRYVARFSDDYVQNVGVIGTDLGGNHFLIHEDHYPIPDHDGPGGGGYDSLVYDKNAKNPLIVGAVDDHKPDPHDPLAMTTPYFTSYGPTDDGRLGVDVVANGVNVYSASDGAADDYGHKTGTSMAAPTASGVAALLLEHWRDKTGGYTPLAASQKGLIMHTATDVVQDGQVGPDYRSGYGLINAAAAAAFLDAAALTPPATTSAYFEERLLESGESIAYEFRAVGGPIKASLSWLDPAAVVSQNTLDDRTPLLVNDLDLWITDAYANVYYPWTLDPNNPSAPATRDRLNRVDNFVQVLIDEFEAGEAFTLHVSHHGDLADGSQVFALFLSGGATGISPTPEPATWQGLAIVGWLAVSRRQGSRSCP